MASLHHRAKRRAEAFEKLEKARAAVVTHLGVDAPATAMPGAIARDSELRQIAEIESVAELLLSVESHLAVNPLVNTHVAEADDEVAEILEEFRSILTPFNRLKEDGEDETLIETLYRLISERAAYLGTSLEKAREIAAANGIDFTLTAESYPSQILQSGVIEPMAAHIADLQVDLEATRLRAEIAEAKAAEVAVAETVQPEESTDIAGDSKAVKKKA